MFRSPTAVIVWWVWLLFAVANLIDLAVQNPDHASAVAAAILVMATGVAYITAQRPRVIADNAGITIVNPLRDHHVGWAGVSKVDLADLLRVHCDAGHGRTKIIYCWAVHYSRRRKLSAEAKARRAAARPTSGRSSFGLGGMGGLGTFGGYAGGTGYASQPASTAEAEAERTARVLSEYATAARAEAVWADGTVEIAGSKQAEESQGAVEAGGASKPAQATAPEPAPRTERPATTAGHLPVAGWLDPLTSPWDRKALLALLIPALILLVICLV